MNIGLILIVCAIVSMMAFILRQALVSFTTGAVAVIGAVIILCSSLGLSFEETIIASTVTMIIWSIIFSFVYDMFE